MGLDQYFYEKRYLRMKADAKEGESDSPSVTVEAYRDISGKEHKAEVITGVSSVIREVGYFRKANQIQGFMEARFTERFGVDDGYGGKSINCVDIILDAQDIKDLYNICKELLAIKGKKKFAKAAAEKLPCRKGFFFGSTEYDEYYRADLEEYVKMVDERMDLDNNFVSYIYHCWY